MLSSKQEDNPICREVHGTYPGAVTWTIYTDDDPATLAVDLCSSGQCERYWIDGILYDHTGSR